MHNRKPHFRCKRANYQLSATLVTAGCTLTFPFTPIGKLFGFAWLPTIYFSVIGMIVVLYVVLAEMTKLAFYKRVNA